MIGRTIGPFEIREWLGAGGIGEVYAALDTSLGREVAIKALRPQFSRDPAFIERFRREATHLARLHHPNITTLFTLHCEGDTLFMIMELARGLTLDTMIWQAGRLDFPTSQALVAQAIEGLGYAHRMGVIHRDVKSSNMIVTKTGVLKLMDFGVARLRGSGRLTRQGSIVGTLAYMAPEQVQGAEGNERSDLYSLAVVLYEMLSGQPPFHDATSDAELIRAQLQLPVPPLAGAIPDLDWHVDRVLQRAFAKDPAARFPTMEAFGRELGTPGVVAGAAELTARRLRPLIAANPLSPTRLGAVPQALDAPPVQPDREDAPETDLGQKRWFRRISVAAAVATPVVAAVWIGTSLFDKEKTLATPLVEPERVIPAAASSASIMTSPPTLSDNDSPRAIDRSASPEQPPQVSSPGLPPDTNPLPLTREPDRPEVRRPVDITVPHVATPPSYPDSVQSPTEQSPTAPGIAQRPDETDRRTETAHPPGAPAMVPRATAARPTAPPRTTAHSENTSGWTIQRKPQR